MATHDLYIRCMCRIERRQLIGYKCGNIAQRLTLQCDHQIKATRDQIHGIYFRIVIDTLCHLVKAHIPLRSHTHLNHRRDLLHIRFIPINQCMIAADHMLCFHRLQLINDHLLIHT